MHLTPPPPPPPRAGWIEMLDQDMGNAGAVSNSLLQVIHNNNDSLATLTKLIENL